MKIKTDAQCVWVTAGAWKIQNPFFCAAPGKSVVAQVDLPPLEKFTPPQPVFHIRLSLLEVNYSASGTKPDVTHGGGVMLAVGYPGTPGKKYSPAHCPKHKFAFPETYSRTIPVYELKPDENDTTEWIDCKTVKTESTVVIKDLPFMFAVWDVTPEYNSFARALTREATASVKEELGLKGEQQGFLRFSEKRAGFQSFPLTALVGLREINCVHWSRPHLAGLTQLSASLTGFSLEALLNSVEGKAITYRDLAKKSAIVTLACVVVGSCGWSTSYECEKQDDTSLSVQKLGRISDCEDLALAAVSGFEALVRYGRKIKPTNKLSREARSINLLDICAYTLFATFESASLTTGFVDLTVARPHLKNLQKTQTLPKTRSGHAWCTLRLKEGVGLPDAMQRQCGCSPASTKIVIIETTTPTVPVTGPDPKECGGDADMYNNAVVESQLLFQNILDLRISRKTQLLGGKQNQDNIGTATFLQVERYLTVAYEGNYNKTYAIVNKETKEVGLTLTQFCSRAPGDIRTYLNPTKSVRDEYNHLFAPFELTDFHLDNLMYREAERNIDRVDASSITGVMYPLTENLRDVKGAVAFGVDYAPEGLLQCADKSQKYDRKIPTVLKLDSGDVVVLPGSV